MKRRGLLLAVAGLLALPAIALGHAERPAFFPDHMHGSVPTYRTTGEALVVCKPDSRRLIETTVVDPVVRERNQNLRRDCRFRHIQAAVNAATNGDRILVLPGVYREEPSRRVTRTPSRCRNMTTGGETVPGTGIGLTGEAETPTYEFHRTCPNVQNLIAIMGDADPQPNPQQPPSDPDGRWCDDKCDLQIEGTGDTRDDVLIQGDKHKLNVVRADRADGIYLKNFTIEFSDFNNIYALETNGFRFDDIESRYSREYGLLSFTSDNGLYEHLDAHHAGDSGVYPGSGPEGHCGRYGIEIRNVDSHDNTIGWSGTAGNGVWTHDSRFHHNSTGITMDSFASGHPGMPQDCSKFEGNRIYSNNLDLFNDERDDYCRETPYPERDPETVCPTFQVPEGTGLLTAGGNQNTITGNLIYDNWRSGTRLLWVPAAARGETDPTKTHDTSWGNRTTENHMGQGPDGGPDPNGIDFWWDEENGYESFPDRPGLLNCWERNSGSTGGQPSSDPSELPDCTGERVFLPGNAEKQASQAACAAWDPSNEATDSSLPGCDWFTNPSEPRSTATAAAGTTRVAALGGDVGGASPWPALLLIAGAGIMSAGLVLSRGERG